MIPSHRILPSNAPPVDSDRVLRHTSGNANFPGETHTGKDPEVDSSDEEDEVPETNARLSIKSRHRHAGGSAREAIRSARDTHADRHARSSRLRALAHDPSSVFIAKYEDRVSGRKFQRRERIAEAILPEEKALWQHHMLEEQAKEQQRKRAYLERERKELVKQGENAGQVVWSRVLDDAYQIAIRCVPPILGKKKMSIPDGVGGTRLAGRNELISRKIFQLTGQMRYRKQISSHNQVLRKFRVRNPHGVDVGTLEKGKDSQYVRIYDTKNLQWDDENGRLIYVDPNPQSSKAGTHGLSNYNDCLPSNAAAHFLNGQWNQSVCIQSVDFAMNQYAPESEDRYLEVVEHQYTTLQSTMGARPQPLEEVPEWRSMFPGLASLEEKNELQNCDIVLFEVSLAIGQPPRGKSRLSIKFNLDLYCHPGYRNWNIRTTFCEDKGIPRCAFTNNIDTTHRKDANRTELVDVPFTSHWWRDLFSGIMKRRWEREQLDEKKIEDAGHGHCGEDCDVCAKLQQAARARLREEDEHSNRYLQELSVMQELFATDRPGGNKTPRRVAVFLWRFRRAWPGEAATTIWRRLDHPNQPNATDPSLPPLSIPLAQARELIHPVSSQDKGLATAQPDEYLGADPSSLQDAAMQYQMHQPYWDHCWVPSQLSNANDAHDDPSASASFPACASSAQYGYLDPSPSTQTSHDSGYGSQGTSYASHTTPVMRGGADAHVTAETNEYEAANLSESGAYGYDEMQQVHNLTMSSFGPVELYEAHDSVHAHSHMPIQEELVSRMDANLFAYSNGPLSMDFLPEDHSYAHDPSETRDAHGSAEQDVSQEVHAPQPLHAAPGSLLGAETAAAMHFSRDNALYVPTSHVVLPSSNSTACSAAEASMLLHLAHGGGGVDPSHHSFSHPATHNLALENSQQLHQHQPSRISSPQSVSVGAGTSTRTNSIPSSLSSSIASIASLASSTACSNDATTTAATAAALWASEALADLPAGLFLDVSSANFLPSGSGPLQLLPDGSSSAQSSGSTTSIPPSITAMDAVNINAFAPLLSDTRERAQETGRLLGALLGTCGGGGGRSGIGAGGSDLRSMGILSSSSSSLAERGYEGLTSVHANRDFERLGSAAPTERGFGDERGFDEEEGEGDGVGIRAGGWTSARNEYGHAAYGHRHGGVPRMVGV